MVEPTALAEHLARIERDGYTIVEGVLAVERAAEVAVEVERLEAALAIAPAQNPFEGMNTKRIYNLLVHGPLFEAIAENGTVLPLVERVLDKGCLVSSLSSIAILPGEAAQPVHADDQLIPLPKPHVPLVCNTMWAITDFTADNGATRLMPGTHRADASPELGREYETVPAEMRAGSVLVYHGSLWHGGGPNRTGARRVGVAMNYCAGWVRQQENQQLGIPLEVARRFSPRLRKLCGFGLYRGVIGHIDKCSPADLLDGTGKRPVVGG
jgi:ectoine hydroxylase-related dioxygenase (phytanoyl-CoA dioxygenase family)